MFKNCFPNFGDHITVKEPSPKKTVPSFPSHNTILNSQSMIFPFPVWWDQGLIPCRGLLPHAKVCTMGLRTGGVTGREMGGEIGKLRLKLLFVAS